MQQDCEYCLGMDIFISCLFFIQESYFGCNKNKREGMNTMKVVLGTLSERQQGDANQALERIQVNDPAEKCSKWVADVRSERFPGVESTALPAYDFH